ncbi:unnamed protein product, partial [marine sediment metagenome]
MLNEGPDRINELPDEILLEITKGLSPGDLTAFSSTCYNLRRVTTEQREAQRRLQSAICRQLHSRLRAWQT